MANMVIEGILKAFIDVGFHRRKVGVAADPGDEIEPISQTKRSRLVLAQCVQNGLRIAPGEFRSAAPMSLYLRFDQSGPAFWARSRAASRSTNASPIRAAAS